MKHFFLPTVAALSADINAENPDQLDSDQFPHARLTGTNEENRWNNIANAHEFRVRETQLAANDSTTSHQRQSTEAGKLALL